MTEPHYPDEPIAQFTTFMTTDGFCYMRPGAFYFPEDVMPAIHNITSEQLKQLYIWKSQVSP